MDTGPFADAALSASVPKERAVRNGRLIRNDTGVALIRIPSERILANTGTQ